MKRDFGTYWNITLFFVCFPCFHKEQILMVPVHPTRLRSHLGFP